MKKSRLLSVIGLLTCCSLFARQAPPDGLAAYTGLYRLTKDTFKTFAIRLDSGHLMIDLPWVVKTYRELEPKGHERFNMLNVPAATTVVFNKDAGGRVTGLETEEPSGHYNWIRIGEAPPLRDPGGNRQRGFTRADSLRGQLTPLRTCYDVLFYHLDVNIDPQRKWIGGSSLVRFEAVQPFSKMQIDLYDNMQIDRILYHGQSLPYTREFDAVYVQFPGTIGQGAREEITVFFNGQPQVPDMNLPMNGGFIWHQDHGKPWAQVVCQGSGASLWWPNKDHLSDEADSMRISVTVPSGLTEISNGRLREKKDLPDGRTRYEWYISYPINNYNVTVNIGDYAHFSDRYINGADTLTLDFYCLPDHLKEARKLFQAVKPMLQRYEKWFGKYPFARDGFTLLESIHAMEHQSAVSIESLKGNPDEVTRLIWHESAHEWWGNNVSVKDMADFWLHEGFASYTEALNIEAMHGKDSSLRALNKEAPGNKEPMTGVYDVNHIHYALWDVYTKGALLVNTLRHVLDNDTMFFGLLRGIQSQFRYKTVTEQEVIRYINDYTRQDLTPFFDQYLHYTAIPRLVLACAQRGGSLKVRYRWQADVKDFRMPVKVTTSPGRFAFIHPTTAWQTLTLNNMRAEDLKVATDRFYIDVKKE